MNGFLRDRGDLKSAPHDYPLSAAVCDNPRTKPVLHRRNHPAERSQLVCDANGEGGIALRGGIHEHGLPGQIGRTAPGAQS